jgi:hypothetical protein
VGDGEAVTYRVRLKLDGKTIDQTELKISFYEVYIFGRCPYTSPSSSYFLQSVLTTSSSIAQ